MSEMTIAPVGAGLPVAPVAPVAPSTAPAGPSGTGAAFGEQLLGSIDQLQGAQDRSGAMAVQAATGDLKDVHDYTIASSQAQVMLELTAAVRNKAVEAFTEIMRMPV
jgi:flagellar hook-basal body complex protein FliE